MGRLAAVVIRILDFKRTIVLLGINLFLSSFLICNQIFEKTENIFDIHKNCFFDTLDELSQRISVPITLPVEASYFEGHVKLVTNDVVIDLVVVSLGGLDSHRQNSLRIDPPWWLQSLSVAIVSQKL